MDFKTGDFLKNGQYRVTKRLGRGGSSVSYLVQDEKQEKQEKKERVIKILFRNINQKILHDEAFLLQECRKHPNIVEFDNIFLEDSIDRCCLVLQYIQGKTLQEYLEQPEQKKFAIGKAIEYIQKIGDAVDFAHQKNLLHRDIKPNNILLRETDDEPILIDFGIARELDDNNRIHTSHHTPGFAPIEQLHPDKVPPRKAGNYTDIHALAATLYILLVGKVGIEHLQERSRELERLDRNGLDLAENDILKSPKDFDENISDRLSAVICQGMAPEPSQRPQTMQDWLKNLEDVLVDTEIPNSSLPQPPIPRNPRKKSNLIQTIDAHSKAIYTVVYHPNNQQIISTGKDGEIKIWNSENFQLIETLAQHRSSIYSLAISSDGKILASGDYDYKITLWDLETYELITVLSQHTGQVLSLDICPYDEILVSGSIDGYINIWDFKTYDLLYTIKSFNLPNNLNSTSFHEYHINPLVIHPDGTKIFNGIFKNMVKIWDLEAGEKIGEFDSPKEIYWQSRYINSIAISPNGKFLLTNDREEIQIWNIETRKLERILKDNIGIVYCLQFSPDGTIIASCGEDCTIKLWNFETGQLLKTLSKHKNKVHKDKVYSLAFSPDGQTLVSGSRDRTLKIWQISESSLHTTEIS